MLPEFFRRVICVKLLLLVLAAIVLFFVCVMIIDSKRFVVRTYTVQSAKIHTDRTLVFLTDLHNRTYGKKNEKLLSAIRAQNPDAVLVGGDTIISHQAREDSIRWMQVTLDLYGKIAKDYPLYFADGNHEGRLFDPREENGVSGANLLRAIDETTCHKAVYLNNRTVYLGDLAITGLDLPMDSYQKLKRTELERGAVESLVGKADPKHFRILLAHNPKYFEEYARWGADLVLSGHMHGGLMRFPKQRGAIAPDLSLFPPCAWGTCFLKKGSAGKSSLRAGERKVHLPLDTCEMILSCGLGSHTLPIRIFNPGELTVVKLKGQKKQR